MCDNILKDLDNLILDLDTIINENQDYSVVKQQILVKIDEVKNLKNQCRLTRPENNDLPSSPDV